MMVTCALLISLSIGLYANSHIHDDNQRLTPEMTFDIMDVMRHCTAAWPADGSHPGHPVAASAAPVDRRRGKFIGIDARVRTKIFFQGFGTPVFAKPPGLGFPLPPYLRGCVVFATKFISVEVFPVPSEVQFSDVQSEAIDAEESAGDGLCHTKSRKKAINDYCRSCSFDPSQNGSFQEQITICPVLSCELWPLRPMTKPRDRELPAWLQSRDPAQVPASFRKLSHDEALKVIRGKAE